MHGAGAGGAQRRHPPVRLQTERAGDAAGAAHAHLYRVRSAIVAPSVARARVVRRIDAPPTYRASPPRPQPRPTVGERNAEAMPAPARQSSAATPRGWYRTYDKFVSGEAVNKELQASATLTPQVSPCRRPPRSIITVQHGPFPVIARWRRTHTDLLVFNDTMTGHIEGPRAPAVKPGRITQARRE
jgi:hypothetical protein